MIKYIKGDMLQEKSGLLVHGCNASGGFGSGIAGQIRTQFPKVYEKFKTMPRGENSLGQLQVVKITKDLLICNAFTQLNYGSDGKRYASPEAIAKALDLAFEICSMLNYELKAPKIGCGLGGLSWETEVQPIFESLNKKYSNVNVKIYEL